MSPPGRDELALSPEGRQALGAVVALLAEDEHAPTTVTSPGHAWDVHVADSLSGLELAPLAAGRRICDVGAGAGFPGLALAAALPEAHVDLLESNQRKCEFMQRAIAAAGLGNTAVVCDRAETWAAGAGAGAYDTVTARAVGRLSTLAELASPLLSENGVLVAWKGRRDPAEEAELDRASAALAMAPEEILWVGPYAGSEHRHLHLIRKSGPTPEDLPRRPGMAKKRPKGSQGA